MELVSNEVQMMRLEGVQFEELFPRGYGSAAEPNFVTDLYGESLDLGMKNPFLRNWNRFAGSQYSGEVDGKLLINIENIEDGLNALMTAQHIVLVFGQEACGTEDRFWHLDVVGLRLDE